MKDFINLSMDKFEEKFHFWLKREIEMMREILSNLHQEELCLMLHDKERYDLLNDERLRLRLHLEEMQEGRDNLLKSSSTDELEIEVLKDVETSSLLGQIEMLKERIEKQTERNDSVLEHHPYTLELPKISEEMLIRQNPQCIVRKNPLTTVRLLDERKP